MASTLNWWGSSDSESSVTQGFFGPNKNNYKESVAPVDDSECGKSIDCASGFACVKGKCVKVTNSNQRAVSSCGSGSNDTSGCGSFSKSDDLYTVTSPGSCSVPAGLSCCGSGSGEKQDVQEQVCTSFCAAYKASYGLIAAGCSELTCDECSFCFEGKCVSSGSGPCKCNNGATDCISCNEDGTSSVSSSCQECADVPNYQCPGCNKSVSVRVCRPLCDYGTGLTSCNGASIVNVAQAKAAEECAKVCPTGGCVTDENCPQGYRCWNGTSWESVGKGCQPDFDMPENMTPTMNVSLADPPPVSRTYQLLADIEVKITTCGCPGDCIPSGGGGGAILMSNPGCIGWNVSCKGLSVSAECTGPGGETVPHNNGGCLITWYYSDGTTSTQEFAQATAWGYPGSFDIVSVSFRGLKILSASPPLPTPAP